jgi:hypothetical protein
VLGASAALEDGTGQRYTADKLWQLHKEGVDVSKMLEEQQRRSLWRRAMEKALGNGKGDFDAEVMVGQMPKAFGIDDMRVRLVRAHVRARGLAFVV